MSTCFAPPLGSAVTTSDALRFAAGVDGDDLEVIRQRRDRSPVSVARRRAAAGDERAAVEAVAVDRSVDAVAGRRARRARRGVLGAGRPVDRDVAAGVADGADVGRRGRQARRGASGRPRLSKYSSVAW